MGGEQSTRRITIINEEATGSIKITDAAILRLKDTLANGGSAASSESGAHSSPSSESKEGQSSAQHQPPPPVSTLSEEEGSSPSQDPAFEPRKAQPRTDLPEAQTTRPQAKFPEQVHLEDSMISLRVKAEKEKEMAEVEAYWRDRLHTLEQNHKKLSNVMESSLAEHLTKMDNLFIKPGGSAVCTCEQESVRNCLQLNGSQSLRCSPMVEQYIKCVNAARMG